MHVQVPRHTHVHIYTQDQHNRPQTHTQSHLQCLSLKQQKSEGALGHCQEGRTWWGQSRQSGSVCGYVKFKWSCA